MNYCSAIKRSFAHAKLAGMERNRAHTILHSARNATIRTEERRNKILTTATYAQSYGRKLIKSYTRNPDAYERYRLTLRVSAIRHPCVSMQGVSSFYL